MGYFDGMENQKELEIYFKKLVSAFISLSDDLLKEEERERQRQTIPMAPVMPTAVRNCKP